MFATAAKYIQESLSFWFSIDFKLDKIQSLFYRSLLQTYPKPQALVFYNTLWVKKNKILKN